MKNTAEQKNEVITRTEYELEVMRRDVTPGQFLAYVRARAKAKGINIEVMSARDFAKGDGWNFDYSFGTPDSRASGCAAERSKGNPYDKQTYIRWYDGSVYNEIIEFDFDDEKTGHGYYYIVEKRAPEDAKQNNERIYFESVKAHAEREIAKAERKIAENERTLENPGFTSLFWLEHLRTDNKIAEAEIKSQRDIVAECEELIAERTEKAEEDTNSATEEEAAENMKGEQSMEKAVVRFEIGNKYGYAGLYGGWYEIEVVNRTEDTVTMRKSWIAEDSGKVCHADTVYPVEVEEIPGKIANVERVAVWEYRGSFGYVYAAEVDRFPDDPGDDEVDIEVEEIAPESPAITVAAIRAKVEATSARSAWARGVKEYAGELLDELDEAIAGGYFCADDIAAPKLLERQMLNGASDWAQYSWGGCSLCYDGQIAARLCAPWELKKTDNGRKDPNPRETWIDVQTSALFQASRLILEAARA